MAKSHRAILLPISTQARGMSEPHVAFRYLNILDITQQGTASVTADALRTIVQQPHL